MTVDRLLQIKQTISQLPIKITSGLKQSMEYDIYLISYVVSYIYIYRNYIRF